MTRRTLALSSVLLSLTLLAGCGARPVMDGPPEKTMADHFTVTRVTDGDTVEVRPEIDGANDVRLIGVDTPEKYGPAGSQPLADEATVFTERILEETGNRVTLRFDAEKIDRYGRVLAYMYLRDGAMHNRLLLEEGYAQVATFPPNVRHLDEFRRAQEEAREAGRGIWGLPARKRCALADRGNGIGGGC
ncbi:MAG TPA: thermonuclease family protein [Rubrobacteraceae bacterium]|nr:thermonuclease family protein [Rubrobacteraceae bacterium]